MLKLHLFSFDWLILYGKMIFNEERTEERKKQKKERKKCTPSTFEYMHVWWYGYAVDVDVCSSDCVSFCLLNFVMYSEKRHVKRITNDEREKKGTRKGGAWVITFQWILFSCWLCVFFLSFNSSLLFFAFFSALVLLYWHGHVCFCVRASVCVYEM